MQISQQVNKSKPFRRASFRERTIAAVVCVLIVGLFASFWVMGSERINIGRWINPCGFKQRYDLPCPSCGMTTATLAFARGKIAESFYIQPAAALVCAALAISAFLAFIVAVFGVYFEFLSRIFTEIRIKHVVLALIIIISAAWAVTLARAIAAN